MAQALGYSDTNKAIAMHVDDEDKLNDKTASSLGQRGGWFINESGLYCLVLSSKLPGAKGGSSLPPTLIASCPEGRGPLLKVSA